MARWGGGGSQSVSESVSRVVLMQSGRRVQGVSPPTLTIGLLIVFVHFCGLLLPRLAHTGRGGERWVRVGSGRGSGARNSQERHVCHCYLRANRTIPRERFRNALLIRHCSRRYVSGVAHSVSYWHFRQQGAMLSRWPCVCGRRQTFNFASFQTKQP